MSSGGWEVVGKNKKDKLAAQSAKQAGKHLAEKQTTNSAPKIEDILPLNQVKSLYNFDGRKAIKKSKDDGKKLPEADKKKQQRQKQKQQQSETKKVTTVKPKAFRTLEDAMEAINHEQVYNILEVNRVRFPDTSWVWLEDLATFLNKQLIVDKNPVYPPNPKDSLSWPLCVVPSPIRTILEQAIDMTEESQAKWFHKSCYTKLWKDAIDDTRLQLNGYKIFFQLLIQKNLYIPVEGDELPVISQLENALTTSATLREGAPQVFWALLQYSYRDLGTGLKMWQERLSPNLYSHPAYFAKPTANLLNRLILCHENSGNLSIDLDLFLDICAVICSKNTASIESAVQKNLQTSLCKLRNLYLKLDKKNLPRVFETVMSRITPKLEPRHSAELVEILSLCLASSDCHSKWRSLYLKHLYPSSLLLTSLNKEHLFKEWSNIKIFRDTFAHLDAVNKRELQTNGQKGHNLKLISACNATCEAILTKMTLFTRRKFPWRKGCFLLLILIGGILAFDYQKHGTFEASDTGKFIRNYGIDVYIQKIWHNAKTYLFKGLYVIETVFPDYYKATAEFIAQYTKLTGDFYLIARNISIKWYNKTVVFAEKNAPVIVKAIDDRILGFAQEVDVHVTNAMETFTTYYNFVSACFMEHATASITWLEQNIFVGKLSPENLQSYATQAIDTTQTFASRTYDWVYEKVQTLSKVP